MSKEISRKNISKASIINLLLFISVVTMTFWILDSFVEWFFFNADHHRGLLELFITDVPPENLYIRGMFFGLSCFFGLFMAKYVSKYEEVVNFLMQNVDRFEQLMDNAPDMICRIAIPNGRYDYVSKASTILCGHSPKEFYKRPRLMEDLAHPDWEDYLEKKWKELVAGKKEPFYQYQIITKAGETRWINQRNTFYTNAEGKPTSIEAILTDVTDFKIEPLPRENDHKE
jgi:PAS domain S-box-containing protein